MPGAALRALRYPAGSAVSASSRALWAFISFHAWGRPCRRLPVLPGRLVELLQAVAGDRGEGVVLGVPLHVPVHERGERVDLDRAAALAEVVRLRLAPHVHGGVHQGVVPACAVELRQAHHHDQEPLADRDGPDRERHVEQELGELAPVRFATLAVGGLLVHVTLPHAAPRVAQVGAEDRVDLVVQRRHQGADIDHLERLLQHLFGGLDLGVHALALAAAVQRVAVVVFVAHAVGGEVGVPVDEPDDAPEQVLSQRERNMVRCDSSWVCGPKANRPP